MSFPYSPKQQTQHPRRRNEESSRPADDAPRRRDDHDDDYVLDERPHGQNRRRRWRQPERRYTVPAASSEDCQLESGDSRGYDYSHDHRQPRSVNGRQHGGFNDRRRRHPDNDSVHPGGSSNGYEHHPSGYHHRRWEARRHPTGTHVRPRRPMRPRGWHHDHPQQQSRQNQRYHHQRQYEHQPPFDSTRRRESSSFVMKQSPPLHHSKYEHGPTTTPQKDLDHCRPYPPHNKRRRERRHHHAYPQHNDRHERRNGDCHQNHHHDHLPSQDQSHSRTASLIEEVVVEQGVVEHGSTGTTSSTSQQPTHAARGTKRPKHEDCPDTSREDDMELSMTRGGGDGSNPSLGSRTIKTEPTASPLSNPTTYASTSCTPLHDAARGPGGGGTITTTKRIKLEKDHNEHPSGTTLPKSDMGADRSMVPGSDLNASSQTYNGSSDSSSSASWDETNNECLYEEDDLFFDKDEEDETNNPGDGSETDVDAPTEAPNPDDEAGATAAPPVPNTSDHPFFYNEKGEPMAFCCANCRCPDHKKRASTVQACDGDYHHRHCCHNTRDANVAWRPRLHELHDSMEEFFEEHDSYPVPDDKYKPISARTLKNEYIKKLQNEQTKTRNNDEDVDPVYLLMTNEKYNENSRKFAEVAEKERQNGRRPAVVLDAFSGVGAGLVALKKLGIAMSKVIHVEHDKVAAHVVKHRHDCQYNTSLPDDGIKHLFLSKFEEIDRDHVDRFLKDHGPIDIIIGGPPCSDYAGVNAHAQGPQGTQGEFLPRFATFIQDVQNRQPDRPVFYLIENVEFTDSLRVDNYGLMENITGLPVTKQNALYFSPCRRNRSFWHNFPINLNRRGYDEALGIRPSSCLENGWQFPGEHDELVDLCKVGAFMASKSRINDYRMVKARPLPNGKFEIGRFSVLERERMMGFPERYIQGAVEQLFKKLLHNALELRFPSDDRPESLWRNRLDRRFYCFSGEPVRYEEAYNATEGFPFIGILMSPPQVTLSREFFNAEDYSKRLLGNSFSIPVVEYVLTKLCDVFAKRQYDGYSYQYCWENANSDDEDM